MIWNLAEIWVTLAVAFVLGCFAGSLLYHRLAVSRYGGRQEALAEDIAGAFDSVRETIDGVARRSHAAMAGVMRRRPAAADGDAAPATAAPAPAEPGGGPGASAAVEPEPQAEPDEPETTAVTEPTPTEVLAGRPPSLPAPRSGAADDLRRIRGIGESYEARLHALGIFQFDQIAAWSLKQAAWVAIETGAGDRVVRYDWVGQAKALAGITGGPPEEE